MFSLFTFLLLWVASRYPPVKYIYDWIKFLYQLRFPNRLLILAACPLLILSGLTLQALYYRIRTWSKQYMISLKSRNNGISLTLHMRNLITFGFFLVLVLSITDVYKVNKGMAFGPNSLDPQSFEALSWLKRYDSSLYYTDLGDGSLFWSWTPAAYELEMPVINFIYNQRLVSADKQASEDSPFVASPKYQFLQSIQTPDPGAVSLHEFDGINLWYYPDALPFAFTVPSGALEAGQKLDQTKTTAEPAAYNGPNRVQVVADSNDSSDLLVVLVSNFPGWKLKVDDKPASLIPVNDYLGAKTLPGKHTYIFIFDPPLYRIGLLISLVTVLVVVAMLLSESSLLRKVIQFFQKRESEHA
jgi:hypothetical protein